MKVFVIPVLCALVGYAAGGSVGWPGAVAFSAPLALSANVVKTVIPGETKTTAYSTTQYINAVPGSYSFGAHPQLAYQVAQLNGFAPLPTGYIHSFANPAYIPATNVFYQHPSYFGAAVSPALPSAPSSPSTPAPIESAFPSQTSSSDSASSAGDADSTVIDSIDFPSQQQQEQLPQSANDMQLVSSQFPPSNNFNQESGSNPSMSPSLEAPQNSQSSPSAFPQYTQIPQIPQSPQIPQYPQEGAPAFPPAPQFPQIPQNPQDSAPSFPQFPQLPQNPGISPPNTSQIPQAEQNPSFPQYPPFPMNSFEQGPSQSPSGSFSAPANNDSALNDEDTISVESA